jgi:hypothetical protein
MSHHHRTAWARLTTTARLAPPDTGNDFSAPAGFATRVVALAQVRAPALTSLYELLSWRALAAAALVALLSVAANLGPVLRATGDTDEAIAVSDPVAEVLDLT